MASEGQNEWEQKEREKKAKTGRRNPSQTALDGDHRRSLVPSQQWAEDNVVSGAVQDCIIVRGAISSELPLPLFTFVAYTYVAVK